MRCLSLYAKNTTWTYDVICSIPLRQWRYLPVVWWALEQMQDPRRPGNG